VIKFTFLLSILIVASTLKGAVVYDSFGPGGVVTDPPNWAANAIGSRFTFGGQVLGAGFVPSGDFFFDSLEIPLGDLIGLNSIEISLAEDFVQQPSGDYLPGAILETFTIADPLLVTGTGVAPTIVSAISGVHPLLQSGLRYWVIVEMTDPTASVLWNISSHGARGPWAYSDERFLPEFAVVSPDLFAQVMRVHGTAAVPEPGSALLLGSSLLALTVSGWRRAVAERRRRG
jgi:hypothetical protein